MHIRHQHPTFTCRNQSSTPIKSLESPCIQFLSEYPTFKSPTSSTHLNKSDPRNMKDTIFANTEYHAGISNITNTTTISDEIIKQNLKINHTKAVEDYLNSKDINE